MKWLVPARFEVWGQVEVEAKTKAEALAAFKAANPTVTDDAGKMIFRASRTSDPIVKKPS